jgi:hypothetical protein
VPIPAPAPKSVEPVIEQPKSDGTIRKSKNNRCHSSLSPNYDTMTITGTYNTFEECEAAGGVKYK